MSDFIKFFIVLFYFCSLSYGSIFPKDNWQSGTFEELNVDQKKFNEFLKYTFSSDKDFKTDSVVVIYKGKLLYEQYANGYDSSKLHLFWSATKSVSSLLTGILHQEGRVRLDDQISQFYPDIKSVTVKHLLNMSSSIDWNEGYESNPLNSNVIQMLYTSGRSDMASYTASLNSLNTPGDIFKYSSGETNLLMGYLKKKIGDEAEYSRLPWEKIFRPLGIKEAVWERDQSGTFIGSSYLYLRPKDFARIGYLYLREGKWHEKQIISKEWVNFSRTMAPAFKKTKLEGFDNREGYGAKWWLNLDIPSKNEIRPYPDAPSDLYMALGHHGQMVGVIPSKDLVVVRTAEDKSGAIDKNEFYKLLIDGLEK